MEPTPVTVVLRQRRSPLRQYVIWRLWGRNDLPVNSAFWRHGSRGLFTTLYTFTGGADGSIPTDLVFDSTGALYGAAYGEGASTVDVESFSSSPNLLPQAVRGRRVSSMPFWAAPTVSSPGTPASAQ